MSSCNALNELTTRLHGSKRVDNKKGKRLPIEANAQKNNNARTMKARANKKTTT